MTIETSDKRTTIGALEKILYFIYSGNIIRLFGMWEEGRRERGMVEERNARMKEWKKMNGMGCAG
jgi:hypothetical protein